MAGMPGPLRVHAFSSAACVHAVESFGGVSSPPHRSGATTNGRVISSKEMKKTVKKLLSRISQASFRSRSRAASREAAAPSVGMHDAVDESDEETFVSANNSKLSSFRTYDDDGDDGDDESSDSESELSSFCLTPLIFPVGVLEYRPSLSASPVKVVQKLPFGYVIGRKQDAVPAPPPSLTLMTRKFKKMMAKLADLQLRSRLRMLKNKVVRAPKERFRRGSRSHGRDAGGSGEGDVHGCHDGGDHSDDDQDVFWKKDVRGLRCRRVEDDEPPY